MASEEYFRSVPPFPDDVPTAPIPTISLADLHSGNTVAAKCLLRACENLGFFLLDLRGDKLGEAVVNEVDSLFGVAKDIMNLPDEVKAKYPHDVPKSFLGFKPRGVARTETNEPDRFEWFNLGQDGLVGNAPLQPLPDVIHSQISLFTSFLKHGQMIASVINQTLATQLSLAPETFTALQTPEKSSGTVVRIIKADASPLPEHLRTSMHHHTDFGTITLLANVLGGLQILDTDKAQMDDNAWLWVRPQPGCLIVNLGDAMVQWTGGVLRSNVHRINYSPGQQRYLDRYSLAILFRPERNASMKRLIGEGRDSEDDKLTAWEWEVKRMMSYAK